MAARQLIEIGNKIRVYSCSFVTKNIFLKVIFSIRDPLRFFIAPLLAALLVCVAPPLIRHSRSSAEAQSLREQHARLRAAMDRNDQAEAESLLRGMLVNDPDAFARNNYDYLLARLLQNRQAGDEAGTFFLRVLNRNSSLAGYALWHLAEIARARGDYAEEQKLLRKFVSQRGDHPLRERAIERLCDSYFKTGQYQNAIDTMRLQPRPGRDALAMIGEAQLAMKRANEARRTFEALLANGSLDDASLRACAGLDRIDAASGNVLTEAEAFRRAGVYQFNRSFAEARRHYLTLINNFPQSAKRAEALFQVGRGYFLDNDFVEAAKWYERAHDEFPQTDEGEQGFYYVGHCYQYLGDWMRAIARYEAFLKEYPKSDYVGYAHLNAIDTLRSAGRFGDALAWAARAQTNVNDTFIVVSGLFQEAKIRLTQGDYAQALARFTALRSRNLNARGLTATTNAPEVAFMRAYCLEKLGKFDEAINEYLALPELREGAAGYYGRRASERLRDLGANPRAGVSLAARRDSSITQARAAWAQGAAGAAKSAANQALRFALGSATRDEMLKILRGAYSKLPGYQLPKIPIPEVGRTAPIESGATSPGDDSHQTMAGELLFLGLYDEGAPELLQTSVAKSDYAFALPCARGDCASRTVKFSEPLLRSLPEDYRPELLPLEVAEIFYPFPYRDSLARCATARGVDPRFALSIARQETRYNPREKSSAAARGMMQFITSTANQIAAQLGLRDFDQDDLYDPDTAILFGSQYMKNLFEEFGSPQAVAAAYNGSEDSVRRWIARAGNDDVDRLVIEIAKAQTKDYVFKVVNFYNAYQAIYPSA
ncbi:MAG TPA: transglycosylase SLT domain-containing protein [Blastocatellia bacterium]|jgi:soluble lytic murein transglycosylase|nr:transglycosylase SLT domain-containing protein [Blastocatellia bacterium]